MKRFHDCDNVDCLQLVECCEMRVAGCRASFCSYIDGHYLKIRITSYSSLLQQFWQISKGMQTVVLLRPLYGYKKRLYWAQVRQYIFEAGFCPCWWLGNWLTWTSGIFLWLFQSTGSMWSKMWNLTIMVWSPSSRKSRLATILIILVWLAAPDSNMSVQTSRKLSTLLCPNSTMTKHFLLNWQTMGTVLRTVSCSGLSPSDNRNWICWGRTCKKTKSNSIPYHATHLPTHKSLLLLFSIHCRLTCFRYIPVENAKLCSERATIACNNFFSWELFSFTAREGGMNRF